jgi:hypothetical protein
MNAIAAGSFHQISATHRRFGNKSEKHRAAKFTGKQRTYRLK